MAQSVVALGSNKFEGTPFPLVLADRFFHIYKLPGKSNYDLDVFRWDEATKSPVYEIKAGEPLPTNYSTNPTGIVTVVADNGGFLYKFRPKPGVSQIFGKIPLGDELEVRIKDGSLQVYKGEDLLITATHNMFSGCPIGVMIGVNGSLSMGVNWLPEGMQIIRGSEN